MKLRNKVILQLNWRRGSNPACSGTGVKDSRVCFLKTLSVLLTFFRFLLCLFFSVPNSPFSIKSKSPANNISSLLFANKTIRYVKHPNAIHGCLSSFENFAVILYISKQSSYDFCQTFNFFRLRLLTTP